MKPVYYFALCVVFLFACSEEKKNNPLNLKQIKLPLWPMTLRFMMLCR